MIIVMLMLQMKCHSHKYHDSDGNYHENGHNDHDNDDHCENDHDGEYHGYELELRDAKIFALDDGMRSVWWKRSIKFLSQMRTVSCQSFFVRLSLVLVFECFEYFFKV